MSHTVRAKSQRIRFSFKGFVDGDHGALRQVRTTRAAVQRAAAVARRGGDEPSPAVAPEAVPIRVDSPSAYVHFPATVDDLRAVLGELPSGVADGLRGVELTAGAQYPDFPGDEATAYLDDYLDPLTGRRGYQMGLPEVYGRPDDWDYDLATATAHVYGFVYATPLRHQALKELFLRHHMLAGFAKALAFHHARADRLARGRRMPHEFARTRRRARALADAWVRDVVTPYLTRVAPDAVARFEAWTLAHGGVALPLHVFETFDDHLQPGQVIMGGLETLADLLRKVDDGADVATTRQSFAFWLHYDGHFELALAALDQLLADAPDDADAKALRAHVLIHLYRPREAIDAMRALVAASPDHLHAWGSLAWACEEARELDEARAARAREAALRRAASAGG